MATVAKDFRVKAGLVVEGSTATVNGKNIITAGTIDAKGDLLVGSADDAVARLAAGTNGYVLTANSGATNGLEWAAPAAVGTFTSSILFEGATASSALPTSKSPLASIVPAVITFFPLTVAVDPSTISPDFTLKSFVTVAIFYLL